jgi:hypothetical protein
VLIFIYEFPYYRILKVKEHFMYSIRTVREALKHGTNTGYVLFPEIRDDHYKKAVCNHPVVGNMSKELFVYAEKAAREQSPAISYSMFREYEKTGNRESYEVPYYERRRQLIALAMSTITEGSETYMDALQEKLWEWCDLYTWESPAHLPMNVEDILKSGHEPEETIALFSAEMAFALAEIVSILGDKLDEFLIYRINKEIYRRVLNPYKNKTFFWEGVDMNWASVCSASVGAAALYLVKDDNELSIIIHRVLGSLESFLEGFDADGLITEGLTYWHYGFSSFVYFSELLKERTAGKISLLDHNPKIKKIAELPLYLQFPSEKIVPFSDVASLKWEGDYGFLCRLEERLDINQYLYPSEPSAFQEFSGRVKWAMVARKLYWGAFKSVNIFNNIILGTKYYPESQWIIDRRIDRAGKFIAFASKGGHNAEPHNHNDLGNFIIHYDGRNLFTDTGSPEYVKEYFRGETRYSFFAASSRGHSVPVINGCFQSPGREHYAEVVTCKEVDERIVCEYDLTKAYEIKGLEKYLRSFDWDRTEFKLVIKDVFELDKEDNSVEEVFITEAEPVLEEPGTLLIKTDVCVVKINFSRGNNCKIEKISIRDHCCVEQFIYRTVLTSMSTSKNVLEEIIISII